MSEESNPNVEPPEPPAEAVPVPPPRGRLRRMWWRVFTVSSGLLVLLFIVAVLAQWLGFVDRYVEGRIKKRLTEFGVKIEMGHFSTTFGPRIHIRDLTLHNLETGEPLAKIASVEGRIRFSDLLAFRLSRKMDLEELEIDGLEVWATFDKDGNSNFRGLHEGPPTPRLTFDFSVAKFNVKNGVIHYGDQRYDISGNANNFAAQVAPVDRSLPPEKRTFALSVASEGANFAYNDKKVENLSLRAKAKVSRERADIEELVLRSPFSESRLHGTVDDFQKLSYRLELDSSVDLQQAAETLQPGVALRGNGNLSGTVTGEGPKYQVDANFKADALAADQIYLKGLGVTAKGGGENQTYDIAGKAVAELLTAGDFQMDAMQLAGQVTGTGADFRWLGELRAAAARYGKDATVSDLIINDVRAEMKEKEFAAQVGSARAARILAQQAQLQNLQASGISVVRTLQGALLATVDGANVAAVNTKDAKLRGVKANDITITAQNNQVEALTGRVTVEGVEAQGAQVRGVNADAVRVTQNGGNINVTTARVTADSVDAQGAKVRNINADGVQVKQNGNAAKITTGRVVVAGVEAQGAVVGSINVAGVRLAVLNGRVTGDAGDATISQVKIPASKDLPGGGQISAIRAARPVFVLEPSGRYRASFDLSLGSGVLGSVKLGAARAAVVATDTEVQATNFTAQILDGRANGNATINLAGGASRVKAEFSELDVGGLLATAARQYAPLLAGRTTGQADLTFKGTDVRNASGTVEAKFTGETGKTNRLPLNGDLLVRADKGNFNLERAEFRTPATTVTASGQISLAKNTGDLTVGLSSTDAQELQALALTSGLLPPEIQTQADGYAENYGVGGTLAFNGTVRGNLSNPDVEGRASVAALLVNGRNAGSVAATLRLTPDEIRVTDGAFRDPEGGTVAFNVTAPRPANNDITVEATLNQVDAANLSALATDLGFQAEGKLSGRVNVVGLPNNMSGQANITSSAGRFKGTDFGGEFNGLTARATFTGQHINIEQLDAALSFGNITAAGQIDLTSRDKPGVNLRVRGENLSLAELAKLRPVKPGETPLILAGNANLDLALRIPNLGASDYSAAEVTINGAAPQVVINGINAGGLDIVGQTQDKKINLTLATGILSPPQTVTAVIDLTNKDLPFSAQTALNNTDLSPLIAIFAPDAATLGATARATGVLQVRGSIYETDTDTGDQAFSLHKTSGTANFSAFLLQAQDIQMMGVAPVIVQFTPNELNFQRAQFTGAGTNLNIGGTVALNDAGRQNLSVDGRFNLRLLNGFVPDSFFNGVADANVRVGGSYAAPRILGTAAVNNGAFSRLVGNERLTMSGVKAQIRFNQTQVEVSRLDGTLGGGRIVAEGGVILDRFTPSRYRFTVRGNNVTVPLPEGFRSTADGQIEINGARNERGIDERFITGRLLVKRAEYTREIDIASFITSTPETSLASGGGDDSEFKQNTQLDLRLEGRDALVVRTNQIDALGSLSLRLTGPLSNPIIGGRVTATRASLEFLGQRYELTRGYVDLPERLNAEPELNLQAEADIKSYRVIARATGQLSRLRVELKSDPALPQTDIVALITTGQLDTGYAGGSALARTEVGSAASIAAEALVNAPVRRATDRLFGLNRFEIDPRISDQGGTITPTARLTLGKQINRNLSVTYSTNLASDQNQVVAVEYRLSNRLSFVAQYEQTPLNNFSSKNDIFSFEVRFKKKF